MKIKVALPKGGPLRQTSDLLRRAGWGLTDYSEKTRLYRLESARFPDLSAKMFNEKDIPIQVAVGNYDLGICGLDWVEELMVKYPGSALIKVKSVGYGAGTVYAASSQPGGAANVREIQAKPGIIRIASEYPNLAESFALNLRLRRFNVFPLWGAAEVYPPESADLALVASRGDKKLVNHGLVPISTVLDFSTFLIANKNSWETKDLSEVLASLNNELVVEKKQFPVPGVVATTEAASQKLTEDVTDSAIWLALPDGHQQEPTLQLLNKAGIQIDDYPSPVGNRRPTSNLDNVMIKVIRPQDMPLQVANGNFDLAITGRDWLREHLYQFPSSPVKELLDFASGKVRIVAVVSKDLPVADVSELREFNAERTSLFRVASEYINIADKYTRDNHLGLCRIIPTWGATEALLPEDADLLIENTETGRTIARHNLKIIDTLFESTACLIGNTVSISSSGKGERIQSITNTLRAALEES